MLPTKKFPLPPQLDPHQRSVSSLNRTRTALAPVQTSSGPATLENTVAGEQPAHSAASVPATQLPSKLEPAEQLDQSSLPSGEPSAAGGLDEDALVQRISNLWSTHVLRRSEVSQSREQLRTLRVELGKDLSHYKKLLAHTGRSGKWTSFLREQKISRATADRYVQRWEAIQNTEGNRAIEAVSEPTPDQIATLAKTVSAKLLKRLITADSRKRFMDALALALEQSAPPSS